MKHQNSQRRNLKFTFVLTLALCLALLLTACGSVAGGAQPQATAAGASGNEIPTVTIWGSGGQEVREALQTIADAHNAHPEYGQKARAEIQFVVSGTSEQSLNDRLAAAYQAGETDTDFDVIALDDSFVTTIVAQTAEDFFTPIDTGKIPNYANVLYKENVVGDTFIPYRGTSVMLAYNSDVVSNPPSTIEELYQWIRENPGRFSYCDASSGGSGYTFVTTAIYNQLPEEAAMSSDAKWRDEYTSEWDNAFTLMAELHPYMYQTAGKVQYPLKNQGSLDLLATKQIDMTPAYVNMILAGKAMGTVPESIKLQAVTPAFMGNLAGFSIPTIAKDKESALSVIDYFLSYEAQAMDWNTMYATPVVDAGKLGDIEHADWLDEVKAAELRYFAIGNMMPEIMQRWLEEIAPLAV